MSIKLLINTFAKKEEMRNIILLLLIGCVAFSCGTTTEAEVQKPVVEEGLPKRQSVNTPKKKHGGVDPEQVAAQMGLSEEKTDEFVSMWNGMNEKMRKVRAEYREGDQKVLFSKMKEVKDEREAALQSILSKPQLTMFYEIMAENRSKMPEGMRRKIKN